LVTQIDPELCVHMHVMVLSDPYDWCHCRRPW